MAGKTLAENLESVPDLAEGQQVIMPMDKPIKQTGHLQVRPCCPPLAQKRPAPDCLFTASHSMTVRDKKVCHQHGIWLREHNAAVQLLISPYLRS